MADERNGLLTAWVESLASAVEKDAGVRALLRDLAGKTLAYLDANEAAKASTAPPPAAATPSAVAAPDEARLPAAPTVPIPLTFAGSASTVHVIPSNGPVEVLTKPLPAAATMSGPVIVANSPGPNGGQFYADSSDLALVARRCRIKAEAARWVPERLRLREAGEDVETVTARDRELFTRAKSVPDCYLWMMDPRRPAPPTDCDLASVAGCYDSLAQGAELATWFGEFPDADAGWSELLPSVAEAQSALRNAIKCVDENLEEHDQRQAFRWLKEQTAERHVYVGRYMRLDDPAPSANWADVQKRMAALRESWEARRSRGRQRQSLLGKARYHAGRITRAGGHAALDDWRKLAEAIDLMLAEGIPASNVDVRDLLLPLQEALPDIDFPAGMNAALLELDRYLATTAAAAEHAAPEPERKPSAEVRQVADLLRGKKVLLVGGLCRLDHQERLRRSFELEELVWPSTVAHQSLSDFEPAVARPEVALVLLAIRWSSHSYGELKALCNKYGKPFVRLPGGYNAQQVAHAILEQSSGILRAAPALAKSG